MHSTHAGVINYKAQSEKGPLSCSFLRLRGKDSNLDYLIQSQASYH